MCKSMQLISLHASLSCNDRSPAYPRPVSLQAHSGRYCPDIGLLLQETHSVLSHLLQTLPLNYMATNGALHRAHAAPWCTSRDSNCTYVLLMCKSYR